MRRSIRLDLAVGSVLHARSILCLIVNAARNCLILRHSLWIRLRCSSSCVVNSHCSLAGGVVGGSLACMRTLAVKNRSGFASVDACRQQNIATTTEATFQPRQHRFICDRESVASCASPSRDSSHFSECISRLTSFSISYLFITTTTSLLERNQLALTLPKMPTKFNIAALLVGAATSLAENVAIETWQFEQITPRGYPWAVVTSAP